MTKTKRVLKIIGLVIGGLVALAVVAFSGLYLYARTVVTRQYDVPAPAIVRATTPEDLQRGEVLVRTACAGCHTDPQTGKLTGNKLEFPAFFGEFYSSNLTADPVAGIGAVSDGQLARTIRTGIKRDGRLAAMPRLPEISDQDLAAIIAFLRSDQPELAPSSQRPPPSRYALAGTILVALLFPAYPEAARVGIPTPPRRVDATYGAYLANDVFDCFECHTDGFGRAKLDKPGLYGGRLFPGKDPSGRVTYAPNLTPHPSGLGSWTLEDFTRTLRTGISRDGRVIRPPMPLLRLLDDTDLGAIWTYLRSLPPVDHASPVPPVIADPNASPPLQFVRLGCAGCHGEGQRFADKLRGSLGKPVGEVARWIRRPQSLKPDTQMPSYEALLDEQAAAVLASWVQQMVRQGPIPMPTASN